MWTPVVVCLILLIVTAHDVTGEGDGEDVAEEESDSAEFTVAVEGGAVRCAGALVSQRTALTAARCAAGSELWVRAPHARRPHVAAEVLRVVYAFDAPLDPTKESEWRWTGTSSDLALLEMAAPLEGTRPILAASAADCTAPQSCYLLKRAGRGARIVSAQLSPAGVCSARGALWPAEERERALCLVGPTLCQSEWGAGVVCDGKLCGVLSRSARAPVPRTPARSSDDSDEEEPPSERRRCGDTHAAANLPRWRRFLHCAHLHGACAREPQCALVCTERWLHPPRGAQPVHTAGSVHASRIFDSDYNDDNTTEISSMRPTPTTIIAISTSTRATPTRTSSEASSVSLSRGVWSAASHTHSSTPLRPAPTLPPVALQIADLGTVTLARNAPEFEPNRADFKAGEYGDNAADYGAADEPSVGGRGAERSTTVSSAAWGRRRQETEATSPGRNVTTAPPSQSTTPPAPPAPPAPRTPAPPRPAAALARRTKHHARATAHTNTPNMFRYMTFIIILCT